RRVAGGGHTARPRAATVPCRGRESSHPAVVASASPAGLGGDRGAGPRHRDLPRQGCAASPGSRGGTLHGGDAVAHKGGVAQAGARASRNSRRGAGRGTLVVPGVPIEALYRGRAIGYADVVIVEQALDATTMIEVINARTAPQLLDQVVVASAPAARPELARAADSLAAVAKRPAPLAAKA